MVSGAPEGSVRNARPEEAAACRAIEIAGAEMFAPHLPPGAPLAEPYGVAMFAAAAGEQRLLVVDGGDAGLIGFALLVEDADAAHICELDILPAHQGRGHGAQLLDAVSAWGGARGLSRVTITTFRHVPFNRPYYERRGFTEIAPEAGGPGLRAETALQASLGFGPDKRLAMARPIS